MGKLQQTGEPNRNIRNSIETFGGFLVEGFHYLALFAIGGSIVWSAVYAYIGMVVNGHAAIEDILLLFIYLELGAMVGIYFKTNHMPVRFLIYVAITALTRMLILDIQIDHHPDKGIILISVAILLLALATLIIRYGSFKFPAGMDDDRSL
ncbi:MAG: phosphate-starvation-inducible protein PsiE [Gammaproteobacteria bacterium]